MEKNCFNCKHYDNPSFEMKEICLECLRQEEVYARWEYKPITNADKIRAKSDDEMASWLALHPCLPNCPAQTDECFKSSKFESCKKQWLDWLKEEAKEK